MYKLDCERPGRGRSASGLGEFSARAREVELEHEIKRLKQVRPGGLRAAGPGVQDPGGGSHTLLPAPLNNWLSGLLACISRLRQGSHG